MSTRPAERRGAAHASRSGPASQRRRIAASKLAAPPRRPGIVDRPVLLDGLVSASHAPVVLVSAPAGYGKTTLLALWRERDQRPFAWVSLDAADNDPVAFVASLVAALDQVLDLDTAIGDSLNVRVPPLEEVVLPSLVGRLRRARPAVCAGAGRPAPGDRAALPHRHRLPRRAAADRLPAGAGWTRAGQMTAERHYWPLVDTLVQLGLVGSLQAQPA
jgi:hypothetical protein